MENLKKAWNYLEGKKTYLVALLLVVVSYLEVKGYLGEDEIVLIQGLLAALGLASLRYGVEKMRR